MRIAALTILLVSACIGCGTTKFTDTARTATEQLLISDAMDRAVSQLDFRALAGKTVFIEDSPTKGVVDAAYLNSAVRQHLLASGSILKEKRDDADYVLEIRAGAVGTNRHDLLFGVPATTIPTIVTVPGVPNSIPELPLAKRTEQQAVAKISVFAYNRRTGRPVWQSGAVPAESKAKDLWVFGAGPFQRGSIYEGTEFAGAALDIPLIDLNKNRPGSRETVAVADEAYFVEPEEPVDPQVAQQPGDKVSQANPKPQPQKAKPTAAAADVPPVVQTGHTTTAEPGTASSAPPAAAPEVSASPIPKAAAAAPAGQPIDVPVSNTPPVVSMPPPAAVQSSMKPQGSPAPPQPATPATSERSTVTPLPPVVPAPGEMRQPSILDRFLPWRQGDRAKPD